MKKHKFLYVIVLLAAIAFMTAGWHNIFYKNKGKSTSSGTVGKGSLKNAWHIFYKTRNAHYFSFISYYLTGTSYVHSCLYQTLKDAYQECELTCPGVHFGIMECSVRKGGKTLIHRTHQNGLSVDFMVPKIKKNKQVRLYDRIGIFHYLLDFDNSGRLKIDKDVSIDFETMGRQIIALDNAARKNGMMISKVILKIDLKDDFFKTRSGKEVKQRGIYFARNLTPTLNKLHDDHYHIDFGFQNNQNTHYE